MRCRRIVNSKHATAVAYGGSLFIYLLLVAHINVVNFLFVALAAAISGYLHRMLIALSSNPFGDGARGSHSSDGFQNNRRGTTERTVPVAMMSTLRQGWKSMLLIGVVVLIVGLVFLGNLTKDLSENDEVMYSFMLYILCDVRYIIGQSS